MSKIRSPFRFALVSTLAARVVLGVVGFISTSISPVSYNAEDWSRLRVADGTFLHAIVGPWQQWDGLWFQQVAASGYRPGEQEAAFFPLFPGLERLVGIPLGGGYALAGLLVSTVCCFVAVWLLQLMVRNHSDGVTARRTVVLLLLSPVAFFLLAPFSESLFLALSVGAIFAARRKHWFVAGACAALAALTRSVGLLLVIPLVVEVFVDWRSRRGSGLGLRKAYLAVLSPIVAFFGYWLWVALELHIGGGPLAAAGNWGQHFTAPWTAITRSVPVILGGNHMEELVNLLSVVCVIALVPFMWRRVPASYLAYTVVMIPVLCFRTALTTPLMSTSRYALVVFPVFVLLAMLATKRWFRLPLYFGFAAAQLTLFVMFSRAAFIG
jgi:Mannosyltransferase (PIG-V)